MFTEHCDQGRRRFWASLPKKHLGSTFKIFQNPLQFGSGNEKLRSEIRIQGSLRHFFGRLLQKKNYRQHGKLPRSATICGLLSMRTTSTYIVERNVDALIHVHYIVQLQRFDLCCWCSSSNTSFFKLVTGVVITLPSENNGRISFTTLVKRRRKASQQKHLK